MVLVTPYVDQPWRKTGCSASDAGPGSQLAFQDLQARVIQCAQTFLLRTVLLQSLSFHLSFILVQPIPVVIHKDTGYWIKILAVMPVLPNFISWIPVVCLLCITFLFPNVSSCPFSFQFQTISQFSFPSLVFHNFHNNQLPVLLRPFRPLLM